MPTPNAKKMYRGLDLQKNFLLKAVVEQGATAAIDAILDTLGQMGYDTTKKRAKFFDGVSATYVLQSNDIDTNTSLGISDILVPSQNAVKSYVDSAVTSLLQFISDLDASANPNYPAGVIGDTYYISVAGKVGGASGKTVNISDMLICKSDNAGGTEASVGTSWFVAESNRDQATESILGVLKIASQSQVTTGTNDTNAVTPLKLSVELSSRFTGVARRASGTDTTVANTTKTIAHTIAGGIPVVQIFDSSGYDVTDGVDLKVDATNITLLTSSALTGFTWVAVG